MRPDSRNALNLALERGVLAPGEPASIGFFNASRLPGIEDEFRVSFLCEQRFRPEYLKLESAGYQATPAFDDETIFAQGAMVLLGRSRRLNEYQIARAWKSIPKGCRLIVAGNKTDGIESARKWFASHQEITDSFSKYHAKVFWSEKRSDESLPTVELEVVVDGYKLAEGMFAAKGPDKGSLLLSDHFSDRIRGRVADLGAGWGFLSASLMNASQYISRLDLFEADFESLRAARENLEGAATQMTYNWIDVVFEFQKAPYDWVIMNPPFHAGRAAEPEIGQRFIEVAASTLVGGGRLLMVANRNLPYEETLERNFRRFELLDEQDGFKVIEALR